MPTIDVKLASHSYPVIIAPGALADLGRTVAQLAPCRTALLATDANITASHGAEAKASLRESGYRTTVFEIIAEESQKTLEVVRDVYDAMLAARLERRSPVIALGGGVVGDLAGFAAATYQRGLPLVQVPSTLLAMVDAAIGGKTGVNLPLPTGYLGKNLVGAFWQPLAVLIDPHLLRTLEPRHFRCGLAECVKHAVLGDTDLLAFIERHSDEIAALDMPVLAELITRSVRIKTAIVEADERECGQRALLNLGHTFAHAIEPIEALDLRHGEAVAVGLCAAGHCAVETGRIDGGQVKRVRDLLDRLGLPTRLPQPLEMAPLIEEVVSDVPTAAIEAAWRAVGAGEC
jgi:3-dehydroquinate synthase